MTDLPIERRDIVGFDGLPIAVHMVGQGRDLVLIHGYFSNAWTNWIRYGHAARLVEAGFRLILPDLRGHGDSAKPHDAAAYPADALTDDNLGLIEQLGLTDYDLGGYSLGARTTVRMLARGATPRRVILSGMGLRGLTQTRQWRLLHQCPHQSRQLCARHVRMDDRSVPEDHQGRSGRAAPHPQDLRRYPR